MGLIALATLIAQETKEAIYERGLAVARSLSLPVDSWVAGDPTRSNYWYLAEVFEALEINIVGFIGSAFLDYSKGVWLEQLAWEVYGVAKIKATYAATPVTLSNSGGGVYIIEPGDVNVKDSATGKTYTNTSGGTLASGPGTTLTLDFVADEPGSASSAAALAIDTLVTGLLGVTCSNALAAVGLDDESDPALRDRCRAKLGMLSPNGPADAYDFVVRSSDLTGNTEITRSRTIRDSTTGDVTVYVAGASGAVSGAAVTAAQAAVEEWSTPQCITPTVVNASNYAIAVTYDLWLYDSVGQTDTTIKAAIQTALEDLFAQRPIGGDIIAPSTTGKIYQSLIASTIRETYANQAFRVTVSAPGGDTALAIDLVASLGTVTGTIHIEASP